jgi:hypothetical protein
MIQFILSFFGFHRSSTRVFEVRAESSWVENLDNSAKKCQRSRANVIEEAIALYEMVVNTAYVEERDSGPVIVMPLPNVKSSNTTQEDTES